MLDDTDDIHAGALRKQRFSRSIIEIAAMLGREARVRVRETGGILEVIDNDVQREILEPVVRRRGLDPEADPVIAAWILGWAVPFLRSSSPPDGLGNRLLRLSRIGVIREYVKSRRFDSSIAGKAFKRLGGSWVGLGLAATIWAILRGVVSGALEDPVLPTVVADGATGISILQVDQILRRVRKTRLGVAPLEPRIRELLGFDTAVEVVVPVEATTVAVRLPVKGSWGRRGTSDEPTVADRFTDSIVRDLASGRGSTLLVGGLAEEQRRRENPGRGYEVSVSGRNDRATNVYSGVDRLVLRRLVQPFEELELVVSAVLAGCGAARPLGDEEGGVRLAVTSEGAILPLDPQVQGALLATRASAIRNGIGRARAVMRPGVVQHAVLDQDLERYSWLLPGFRVEVVDAAALAAVLGRPMPLTEAALRQLNESRDPVAEQSSDRAKRIDDAVASGAISVREISALADVPRSSVQRLRRSRTSRSKLKESLSSKLRDVRDRTAQLNSADLKVIAKILNVLPRQVRKLLARLPDPDRDPLCQGSCRLV